MDGFSNWSDCCVHVRVQLHWFFSMSSHHSIYIVLFLFIVNSSNPCKIDTCKCLIKYLSNAYKMSFWEMKHFMIFRRSQVGWWIMMIRSLHWISAKSLMSTHYRFDWDPMNGVSWIKIHPLTGIFILWWFCPIYFHWNCLFSSEILWTISLYKHISSLTTEREMFHIMKIPQYPCCTYYYYHLFWLSVYIKRKEHIIYNIYHTVISLYIHFHANHKSHSS